MQSADIQDEIRNFLTSNFLSGRSEQFGDEDPLLGNLIDSTGVIELILFLQERFGINIDDEEVTTENLDSVRNAAAFVGRKLPARIRIL